MPGTRLADLLVRYFKNAATEAEVGELMTVLADIDNEEAVKSTMDELWLSFGERLPVFTPGTSSEMLANILKLRSLPGKRWRMICRRVAAAAIIFLLLGAGTYLWLNRTLKMPLAGTQNGQAPVSTDVVPGGNKATLTLADGKKILLDSTANGTIARQGDARVQKLSDGQLLYQIATSDKLQATDAATHNTLATPRGGQYRLALPDGSKVWLNAASSIKYPIVFTGKERRVEITGEAYLEVSNNKEMPFIVNVNGMQVRVLGTSFNINSYNDEEAVETSLLEGAVSLAKEGSSLLLRPGQQARLERSGKFELTQGADVERAVAWKKGYFSFHQTDLATVMRQIARWYDVEIVYSGRIPDRRFGGEIPRNTNASEVLKMLEESKVHFRMEGKKIIVLP